jgi:alkaline phosphatase D
MKYIVISLLFLLIISCKANHHGRGNHHHHQSRIAFGSCGNQDWPQPVLNIAIEQRPDAFVFLGDNIYGDTDDMDTLANKYARWANSPEYQNLVNKTRIFATWDDHDYGRNDAGRHYPFKKRSKDIFMNHFKIGAHHEMRDHDGIYHTNYIEQDGKKIQLIMLDVRYFKSEVMPYDGKSKMIRDQYFYKLDYMPITTPDSTFLGDEQWQWLEGELKKTADLRLICSGSQFGIEYNGYEAWANYPLEQKKMLNLIKSTKANGVIFLTGDVHYAEISKLQGDGLYPIYDVTASGITSTWDFATPNKNRIEGPVMENHFGLLTIDWDRDPRIKMEIIDAARNSRISFEVLKSEISFK